MVYRLRKGDHYPTNLYNFPWFRLRKLSGEFTFLTEEGLPSDITSKLAGLSDNFHHHKDSVRIGWRRKDDGKSIELMAIIYENNRRTIHPWKIIQPNTKHTFKIEIKKNSYVINIDGEVKNYLRTSKYFLPNLVLKPYYGGDLTAPEENVIEIKYKNLV